MRAAPTRASRRRRAWGDRTSNPSPRRNDGHGGFEFFRAYADGYQGWGPLGAISNGEGGFVKVYPKGYRPTLKYANPHTRPRRVSDQQTRPRRVHAEGEGRMPNGLTQSAAAVSLQKMSPAQEKQYLEEGRIRRKALTESFNLAVRILESNGTCSEFIGDGAQGSPAEVLRGIRRNGNLTSSKDS
jgi:hypothetical protein